MSEFSHCFKKSFVIICMFTMYLSLSIIEKPFLFITIKSSLVGLFVVYGLFPLIFKCSHKIRSGFVFINMLPRPKDRGLANPDSSGIIGINSFFVNAQSNISKKPLSLGVWHILPSKHKDWQNDTSNIQKNEVFEKLLANGDSPIILYAHGNAFNRGVDHRLSLYKVFQNMNLHCIAFDYRGYGDSSDLEPTEEGVIEDLIIMYKWILDTVEKHGGKCPNIFVWGHSLGTGISVHAFAKLSNEYAHLKRPNGLILESPFNNFREELQGHLLGKIYSWIPWFHYSIVNPVLNDGLSFTSDQHITKFSSPVLILHAKDDIVVPYELGVKLFEAAKLGRPQDFGNVEMVSFEAEERFGHKHICNSLMLPDILDKFISKHLVTCK